MAGVMRVPDFDVVVIGGGPGGYVAAIRAAQLGLRTALVEKERVGGLCLNWGCIPSKALLRSAALIADARRGEEFGLIVGDIKTDLGKAVDRSRKVVERMVKGVEFLLKKNGVQVFEGSARLQRATMVDVTGGKDDRTLDTRTVIVATGARARSLPNLQPDGKNVFTSWEAIVLKEPPKHAIIVGGGAIGVEFAYTWANFGSKVTIVEMLDRLLPFEDVDVSRQLEKSFKEQGIEFLTGAKVESVSGKGANQVVTVSTKDGSQDLTGDKVLVAIGMTANTEGLGAEDLGIELKPGGFIQVDDQMKTNVEGVYAIGDVTGELLLAHVASAQGIIAAEAIAGKDTPHLAYEDMPRATYCVPQVASIGLTEAQARERGFDVVTASFPLRGNGKAVALDEFEGFVKLVVDQKYGDIIGGHMIGPGVTELVSELSLGRVLETTPGELGFTVHPHPTISEAVKEAALAINGEAIHFYFEKPKQRQLAQPAAEKPPAEAKAGS
jgi:dihydrolipoamide dehydrogenase